MLAAAKSNPRLAVLGVLAVVLGLTTLFTRVNIPAEALPLPQTIEKREQKLKRLRTDYKLLLREKNRKIRRRAEIAAMAAPLWRSGHRPAQTVVQDEFEDLTRRARVVIQTLGSPRINDYSDNIQKVELTVRIRAGMREISNLLVEVDAATPPFFWTQCTIRPNNPRNPAGVVLSGRVAAFMLKPEATKLLDDGEEAYR